MTNVSALSIKMNQLLNFEIYCRLILGLSWQSHNCVLTMIFFMNAIVARLNDIYIYAMDDLVQ